MLFVELRMWLSGPFGNNKVVHIWLRNLPLLFPRLEFWVLLVRGWILTVVTCIYTVSDTMIISAFLLLSIFVLFLTVVALLLRDKSYQGCDLGERFCASTTWKPSRIETFGGAKIRWDRYGSLIMVARRLIRRKGLVDWTSIYSMIVADVSWPLGVCKIS